MDLEEYIKLDENDRFTFMKPSIDKIINILKECKSEESDNKQIVVLKDDIFQIENSLLEKKLKKIFNYPILNKLNDLKTFNSDNFWGININTIKNDFTKNHKITNIVLCINKYPVLSFIYDNLSNIIYIGVRLLGCFESRNFSTEIKDALWKTEVTDKLLVIQKDINIINNNNNDKLNNFINYFLDNNIELLSNDYFFLIKEFIENKCELGLIVSPIYIVDLLCYYNILKSLGFHIVNQDNLTIKFDNLNIIYDFLIVKN